MHAGAAPPTAMRCARTLATRRTELQTGMRCARTLATRRAAPRRVASCTHSSAAPQTLVRCARALTPGLANV
eukprot:354227-Chlamydomonas_euryale.AAC.6